MDKLDLGFRIMIGLVIASSFIFIYAQADSFKQLCINYCEVQDGQPNYVTPNSCVCQFNSSTIKTSCNAQQTPTLFPVKQEANPFTQFYPKNNIENLLKGTK